jgi:hypothetical protein
MTTKYFVIAVAAVLALTGSAQATLLSEAVSIKATIIPFTPLSSTRRFAAFDPALGTLASLSANLTGTVDYSGPGSPDDEGADVQLQEDPATVHFIDNSADISCVFFCGRRQSAI